MAPSINVACEKGLMYEGRAEKSKGRFGNGRQGEGGERGEVEVTEEACDC